MKFCLVPLLAAVWLSQCAICVRADTGQGRHKKMYAVPAPGPVVIDGKLDDWDLSGQIMTYVVSQTSDTQSARFAVMYDSKALYLSGVVRDTTPMMNRHDPGADGDKGWNADSCQFRISLNPKAPYPLPDSVYTEAGRNNMDVTHLTMYYTDKQEPVLQIAKGMSYQVPRPEWKPFGVVPANLFQAKYVKAADGLGYTFEYAIPWTTLGAAAPLRAGDIVGGTVQFNYSDAVGLHIAGASAWCYDLLGGSGATFQTAGSWGKLLFSENGNLSRDIVEQGIAPAKPLPLKFAYTLPKDSQISIQLMDRDNVVRRILVAQGDRPAGLNVEQWDGMDGDGTLLPAGEYTWKGIYHQPLTQKFLFSPHNAGQPPYKTDDGTGAWGGDHGTPHAVVALDDGIVMAWNAAEAGSGIIRTDLNGKKRWGTQLGAQYLATDGNRIFAAGDEAFYKGAGVSVVDAKDSRPLTFGNGHSTLPPPPGGTAESDAVTGIAYGAGTVYVSFKGRNLIGVYDATSGELKTTWQVLAPGSFAFRAAGDLVGVSDGKLVVCAAGKLTPFAAAHLDDPRGVAQAADGSIYATNGGALQNVSVFDAAGNYVRSIGKEGGRPQKGRYDPSGMLEPMGICLDRNGHLWVAEKLDSPKRISEWDAATGALVNEFFGADSYFGYSYIDPRQPDEIYCHNVLWKIDWTANTCAPVTTIWRPTAPNMMWTQGAAGYGGHPIYFTADNGHQYCYGGENWMAILSMRDGDLYKPIAAIITVLHNNADYDSGSPFPVMTDRTKYKDGVYLWQDTNGDQTLQEDEIVKIPDLPRSSIYVVDGKLNMWTGDTMLVPVAVKQNGVPVYDVAHTASTPLPADNPSAYWEDLWNDPQDGGGFGLGTQIAKYTADGKLLWAFPGTTDWKHATGRPPQAPGTLWGLDHGLGVAGNFTGASDYFGTFHLFTRDGIYVGMIMRDLRNGNGNGPDTVATEVTSGQLVKPDGMNRYFLLSGASDARVTEIFGLDTVKNLPGGTLNLTAADTKIAADAQAAYNALLVKSNPLSIVRGRDGLAGATPVTKASDGGMSFQLRAAYDKENLYLAYDVTSPSDLVNSVADPSLLFKGGNCLDIQLAGGPGAKADRKTPAPGDVRILVTRRDDKPFVVIYHPKIEGFTGAPSVLHSPTGQEPFDSIEVSDKIGLEYTKTPAGYTAVVTVPFAVLGTSLQPGMRLQSDFGVIYGNATGNQTLDRAYIDNNSPTSHMMNDVPSESRIEPGEWGMATVE